MYKYLLSISKKLFVFTGLFIIFTYFSYAQVPNCGAESLKQTITIAGCRPVTVMYAKPWPITQSDEYFSALRAEHYRDFFFPFNDIAYPSFYGGNYFIFLPSLFFYFIISLVLTKIIDKKFAYKK